MNRQITNAPARSVAAALGVAGIALLAGCASTGATTDTADTSTDTAAPAQTPASSAGASSSGSTSSGTYAAGTYEGDGDYRNPRGGVESVHVTMKLSADGTVDSVDVTATGSEKESKQYQSQFIGGIQDEVVGKSIDDLNVTRVAGSSLTSQGFNAAVEQIKTEAAS